MLQPSTEEANKAIFALCKRIAGNREITAVCIYGPSVSGYGNETSEINVLLVLRGFASRLQSYRKKVGERRAFVLAVDQAAFQRDISAGWLGEIAAEKLLLPYEALINSDYLLRQEVTLKRRVVWELLESLVLEFPELSHELMIKPEYFMHETQMERARLFPLIAYRFLNILQTDIRQRNIEAMMKGYWQALEDLAQDKWITLTNGTVRITPKLVRATKSKRIRIPAFWRSVQRAPLMHVFSTLPRMLAPLAFEEEYYAKHHSNVKETENVVLKLEDSKDHVLMPTPSGLVPLSDATDIQDFVRKAVPSAADVAVETKEMGGVLNSVYLLTLGKEQGEQKIVVKKFRDWTGVKWFPLALWSLGTKSFAVLGKSRLEREYALNQYLRSNGLIVPRILHISPKQHLIFQEFVEGKTMVETIKSILTAQEDVAGKLQLVREAGKQIARAHQLGVGLGDCKPENIIVTKDGELCFVDLEQASRDGDYTWDIAEFLYYCGHYVPPLAPTNKIEHVTQAFTDGYIEAGGKKETVMKTASPRYTKVFSIFTQPQVILVISNLCRKVKQQ